MNLPYELWLELNPGMSGLQAPEAINKELLETSYNELEC